MSEDSLLKKIAKMFAANNNTLLAGTDEKIKASEQRQNNKIGKMFVTNNRIMLDAVDDKMNYLKKETFAKIDSSQADTIEILSEVINTGYNHHEERIKRLESELDLPPLKIKQ